MNANKPERNRAPRRLALAAWASLAVCVDLTLAPTRVGAQDVVEEMPVVGDPRPPMDALAGATTTTIEVDDRLLEGVRLDELLAEVPGVQVRRFGGDGEAYTLSIRGSTPAQVPIFLDGVRLESVFGRTDLSALCLDVLDEIQVTRGAGAARAGTGAIGGTVNLVPRAVGPEPETRLHVSAGNFTTLDGSLRHARRAGDWGFSLAYCGFHTDGDFEFQRARPSSGGGASPIEERENNESDRHTGLAQVERLVGRGRLRLTHMASHVDRGTPGLENAPRRFAEERNLSLLSIARFDVPLATDETTRLEATLGHRFERNHFEDPEPAPGRPDPIDSKTSAHAVTPRVSLRSEVERFGANHEFGLLAEGRFEQRSSNDANSRSRTAIALRAELTSRWLDDRLRISPSLRFERFQGLDPEWIPAFFVEAVALDWLLLKGSVSRSYRAPAFGELYLPDKGFERGNEALSAEEAWNVEIGGVLQSPFDIPWLDGEVEMTWFAGEVDESITYQLVSPNTFMYVNSGRSEIRGHELTLRWRPHDWVRVTAARTVTEAKLESTGHNLGGIAVSQIDGRVELGPRDRLRLVSEIHYMGRIPLNSGGTAQLDSRVVFDTSASVDLTRIDRLGLERIASSLWLSLRVRNVGDTAIRDVRSRPRAGRNFVVSFEGVF